MFSFKIARKMTKTTHTRTYLRPVGTDSALSKMSRAPYKPEVYTSTKTVYFGMSQEIPLAPTVKDFNAFAQVVLPDPPAGHHNLALHFFDHDGREAGRILFHIIPPYSTLPLLWSTSEFFKIEGPSMQSCCGEILDVIQS